MDRSRRQAAPFARPATRPGSVDAGSVPGTERSRAGSVDGSSAKKRMLFAGTVSASGRLLAKPAVPAAPPPSSSRLTLKRARNRRRAGSVWSRLPPPRAVADACGRALRRSLPAAAALTAIAGLAGGAFAGYRWVTHSPRFAITEITVRGAHRVDPEALRAQLPVHPGDNVFTSLDGVARAAHRDPWVARVEVRRVLPRTIAIDLEERAAAAVVELGELYLVDRDGLPFKRAALEAGEGERLPIITGIGRAAFTSDPAGAAATVRDAIAAAQRWRDANRPALGEIHLDPHGAVTLHTYEPAIAIQLGALGPELADRMHTFDTAWAGLSDAERARTRAIHLDTRPDHVTVAFASE